MAYRSAYGKNTKKRKKKIKILTKGSVLGFLLLIAIFVGAWFILGHFYPIIGNNEEDVKSNPLADHITEFTHTYGELKNDTLAEVTRNEIDGIDQIEQLAKAFVISAGAVDYRTITGREGYELVTPELREYLENSGDPITKTETCKFLEMVRTAANPQIRKVINFPEQGFCYVEVYCDLTLEDANDSYNTTRWPHGIGSTIEGRWRLEVILQNDEYKIDQIDVINDWNEQRNVKYDKYNREIKIIE